MQKYNFFIILTLRIAVKIWEIIVYSFENE